MKEKKKTKRAFNKGITLIALVITIIVLLILAGVSIATLTGDNGILTKAQTAKTETEKASEEEQVKLAAMNAAMNTQGYKYDTEDGQKVPIPAGFAPTEIEGQNSIKDGVVVVDENGNEFVWIPCTLEEFNKQRNTETDWKTKQLNYNGGTWGDSQPNQEKIQNSIDTNGGFYIGRYEAGIPSSAPFYANSDGAEYKQTADKDTSDYQPVSKKGVPAWNFITQPKAKEAAESMIANNGVHSYLIDSHAWDTTCKVISKHDETKSLTDSTTWGNYYNNKTTKYENLNTLYALHTWNKNGNDGWGYASTYSKGKVTGAPKATGYNRLELSTGASEDFKAYNIYDLAGNMKEWTTENGTKAQNNNDNADVGNVADTDVNPIGNVVLRGGGFYDDNVNNPVVHSNGLNSITDYNATLGFRVVLYLSSPVG